MLYVFQVDTGTMMTFDMTLALDTVLNLKESIWRQWRIPLDRQVLLVSGGECLEVSNRVCNYAAGTDTNPIFLFNKNNIILDSSPTSNSTNNEIDEGAVLSSQISAALSPAHAPSYETLMTRSGLAQQLYELGKEINYKCEGTIHDQHLQHQGWEAVIANLEDIVKIFNAKINGFKALYDRELFQQQITHFTQLVNRIGEVLNSLSSLPLLTSLLSEGEEMSLLDWMTSQDKSNVNELADNCSKCSEKLDQLQIDAVVKEADSVVEKANQNNMKEIKGLKLRLTSLGQLLTTSRKLLSEQQELATAFAINVSRASDLQDASILPDLCASHSAQLAVMWKNHGQLEDIRRRCVKAKEELSANLNTRLKWVMFIQKNISDINLRISVYFESLKKFKVMRRVLKQVDSAEQVYKHACAEAKRRLHFHYIYNDVTAEIIQKMDTVYSDEIGKRKEFLVANGNHFLIQTLFPALLEIDTFGKITFSGETNTFIPEVTPSELSMLNLQVPDPDLRVRIGSSKLESELISLENALEVKLKEKEEKETELFEKIEKLEKELNLKTTENVAMATEISELKCKLSVLEEKTEEEKKELGIGFEIRMAQVEEKFEEKQKLIEKDMETQIKELKIKHQNDMEGVKSRVKFFAARNNSGGSTTNNRPLSPVENYQEKPLLLRLQSLMEEVIEKDPISGPGSLTSLLVKLAPAQLDTSAIDVASNVDYCVVSENNDLPDNIACHLSDVESNNCRVGERVLTYWSDKYEAFVVYNHTQKNIHFLHTESAGELRREEPPVAGFIGVVTDKEFCVARRAVNRYNVPCGFHFYRVKVKWVDRFY